MPDCKYCEDCGIFLGTREELGDHRFNPLKRCPTCQKAHRRTQKAASRKRCSDKKALQKWEAKIQEQEAVTQELHGYRSYFGLQSKETGLLRKRVSQLERSNRQLLSYIQRMEEVLHHK